jgi:hypothetical protein
LDEDHSAQNMYVLDEDHSAQNNMFWMKICTTRLVLTMALALHKIYHVLDEDE